MVVESFQFVGSDSEDQDSRQQRQSEGELGSACLLVSFTQERTINGYTHNIVFNTKGLSNSLQRESLLLTGWYLMLAP